MEPLGIRIGLGIPRASGVEPALLGGIAQLADELRFDSLWVTDHLSHPTPDPLIALAGLAAVTSRLRLGCSVLVVPGRNPAVLAKSMASMDQLSGGRFLPIAGLGRDQQQATIAGVRQRGDALEEVMPLLRRFWSGEPVTADGVSYVCRDLVVLPRPVRGDIDLWLGGEHPRQLRRAARLADGWLGSYLSPLESSAARRVVLAAADEAGRSFDRGHFGAVVFYGTVPQRNPHTARRPDLRRDDLVAGTPGELADLLQRHANGGISKFILMPAGAVEDWEGLLRTWHRDVLPIQEVVNADLGARVARPPLHVGCRPS